MNCPKCGQELEISEHAIARIRVFCVNPISQCVKCEALFQLNVNTLELHIIEQEDEQE